MNVYIRRVIFIALLICFPLCIFAQTSRTHIVQSGETLASIAAKYGISEASVVKDNPSAANMLYPGMELVITETPTLSSSSTSTSLNLSSGVENLSTSVKEYSRETNISDFSYFAASYTATFNFPEYGSYGICGEAFGPRGFGFSMCIGANFGIVDPGTISFLIGPTYGYAVSSHFAVSCPLELGASLTTIEKKDCWSFAGRLVPKCMFKFGKFFFMGGVPVTYNSGLEKIVFCWTAGIGMCL